MKTKIMLLAAVLLLSGCAAQTKTVQLHQSFDAVTAKRLVQPGVNLIEGSALIRQQGGGVVTCAGLPVQLVPKTAYAQERVRAIYGNTARGFTPVQQTFISFTPDHPGYLQHMKTTLCDAQGRFQFDDVADGEFYVVAKIIWAAGNRPQGGSLMQIVSVSGGQAEKIVLSP